ncbi:MAG: S8 family serine peptidase [Clostridia bacterium]|nr:S8 family serine peptidase [Clostridia bacterium]
MWQIKVQKSELSELEATCENLKKKAFIASAYVDFLDITPNVIPDDPWNNASWNEASPAGSNWSVEMVNALSAWDYNHYFNDINIGFVDSGCDYDHEDLNGKVRFTSTENEAGCDEQNHGTHIAGIMGAIPNNKKGISGIMWNGQVYAHDASPNNGTSMTTTSCYNGIVQNIEAGAKVVNLSVGLSTLTTLTETDISNFSTGASSYVAYLLNQGYDFIICQSSGNGDQSGTAVDTRMNGMFCCIDQDETGQSAAMAKKIADRIMVVGSMNSGGSQAASSNYGTHVDLAAPGVSIYSTVIDTYKNMSGTSMSSPLVTAILGVVWSVNPKLTGAEVAEIVKTTASSYRSAYPSVTGQTALPVPNLYTAVQAAIATLPTTDFSELDEAIASIPADLSHYDTASVTALNNALTAARNINRTTASQNQVNQVTHNLLEAMYSLKVSLTSPAQLTIPEKLTVNGWGFPEVKFTCPGATDINITFSNNNIIDTKQSGTTDTATVILSGSSPTKEDIGTITCTVTYTYGGVTHTLKRYIEVVDEIFASYPLVDTNITRSGGSFLEGYYPSLYNIATITGTTKALNPAANASNGYFDFDENSFVCNSDTAVGTQWGGYQNSGDAEVNLMDQTYAPKGYLYVDTSVYSQLSEIPNFAVYIYQYKKCTRASGGTEVLSITTNNENYTVDVTDTELGTSASSVGGSQTYKINGAVPSKTTTVKFYIQTQATSKNALGTTVETRSAVFLDLVIVPQDKSKLSSLLDKLYSANHQPLFYTEDSYEKFEDAFEAASSVCNNPYSEQEEIDEAYENLNNAFLGLKFESLANYSKLSFALDYASQLDTSIYTDYSLGLLEDVCDEARAIPTNYFIAYQPYIDSMANQIVSATDSLPLLCGDLDANKVVDGNDAFMMSCIISGTLTEDDFGEYKYSAADANKDGTVNFDDYFVIYNKGLYR